MKRLSVASKNFSLVIGLLKTNIFAVGCTENPSIKINDYELGVVTDYPYLVSNISGALSLHTEISMHLVKTH